MKRILHILLILSVALFMSVSCKKQEPVVSQPIVGDVSINVFYSFDGAALEPDTFRYTTAAGQLISVQRLQYYISGIRLQTSEGKVVQKDEVYYLDFREESTNNIVLKNLPLGDYKSISFYIGLDSAHNLTGSLPDNYNNINMAWPDAMGGGYHFMKLEGQFFDADPYGYAVHLGRNKNLVEVNPIPLTLKIQGAATDLNLYMNVAQWFKEPHIYDFNIDGYYTMSDMAAMMKIAANGKDVFQLN